MTLHHFSVDDDGNVSTDAIERVVRRLDAPGLCVDLFLPHDRPGRPLHELHARS